MKSDELGFSHWMKSFGERESGITPAVGMGWVVLAVVSTESIVGSSSSFAEELVMEGWIVSAAVSTELIVGSSSSFAEVSVMEAMSSELLQLLKTLPNPATKKCRQYKDGLESWGDLSISVFLLQKIY